MELGIRLKIETVLSSFTTGLLQDAVNLSLIMNANGLDFNDIIDYLAEKRKEIILSELAFKKPCVECGDTMGLSNVNTGKGDITGDHSKTVWTCENCFHQEFNTYTAKERLHAVKGEN